MHFKSEVIDITSESRPSQVLASKIKNGPPGLQVVYARDWMLSDALLGAAAWALYEQGKVDLVQRRLSSGRKAKFEYIAIKRKEPDLMLAMENPDV
ncbi:hypothetical protein K3725_01525 [Leisingera sp. S132]|uniref:hypothetical protein n=1 Tax=Leisingera sp. S132 TaxID=2867016 RepID=UPI0021A4FC68|nr:hypothetical protein [Leisingera sp. S132]UWQ79715.1 hypothetical protein K3725_01525 [Leisingera sp. S132]